MTQAIKDFIAAGEKCTKFDLDTAEIHDEGACECPLCDGEGVVETDTYVNIDGVALNVQFSGIGDEFVNWHKFVKQAANARADVKAMYELMEEVELALMYISCDGIECSDSYVESAYVARSMLTKFNNWKEGKK